MGVELRLDVADLTEQQGQAAEMICGQRNASPVVFRPSRRVRYRFVHHRTTAPMLSFEREDDLFDDDAFAGPEQTAWLAARAAGPFADSIDALGEVLLQGFTLRAAWLGDPVDAEFTLTARELSDLARARGLTERTLYRVATA